MKTTNRFLEEKQVHQEMSEKSLKEAPRKTLKKTPITLYHVSLDFEDKEKLFTPREPEEPAEWEPANPRICFADSLKHCLTAMSCQFIDASVGNGDAPWVPVTIYKWETYLENQNLVKWEDVYNEYGVLDAYYTKEHWSLEPVVLKGEYKYIRVLKTKRFHTFGKEDKEIAITLAHDYLKEHYGILIADKIKGELLELPVYDIVHGYFSRGEGLVKEFNISLDERKIFMPLSYGDIIAVTSIETISPDDML